MPIRELALDLRDPTSKSFELLHDRALYIENYVLECESANEKQNLVSLLQEHIDKSKQ